MIKVIAVPAFTDNYLWLGIDTEQSSAFVVDPGDATPILNVLKQQAVTLTDILITHHHADHIGGVQELISAFPDVNVYGPNTARFSNMVTSALEEHQLFTTAAGNVTFETLFLPGHTIDHIGFYTNGMAFVGDTLFSAGCGRLFEGTPEQMLDSLNKLKALPSDTLIYCAHEYTLANLEFAQQVLPNDSAIAGYKQQVIEKRQQQAPTVPMTINSELKVNPFLRCGEQELQRAIQQHNALEFLPDELMTFANLRKWKDDF